MGKRIRSVLVVLSFTSVCGGLMGDDLTSNTTPSEIISTWRQRADRLSAHRIVWQHDVEGMSQFSHFQSKWAAPDETQEASSKTSLTLDGDQLLYEGVRWAPHRQRHWSKEIPNATSKLGKFSPERMPVHFQASLFSHFRDKDAEYRSSHAFRRVFDGRNLQDFWVPNNASDFPRVTIHKRPEYASTEWAMLTVDHQESDKIGHLDLMAAVMAMHPSHPLIDVRQENCRLQPELVLVTGSDCLVMGEELNSETGVSRTFWIDPSQGYVIRRLTVFSDESQSGIQVDISYQTNEHLGWVPDSWTVMKYSTPQKPIVEFVRSSVLTIEPSIAIPQSTFSSSYPQGAWIIDEVAQEQYLVPEEGQKRPIEDRELQWLPTYAELLQTEPGEAGTLIQSKIWWRQYWQKMAVPLLVGGFCLLGAMAFSLKKRLERSKAVSSAV